MAEQLSYAAAMKKVAGYGLAEFLEIVGELSQESTKKGALDRRIKELITLGLALAKHCHRCIDIHGREAARIGASEGEIEQVRRIVLYMNAAPDPAHSMWNSWVASWQDYAHHRGPLADFERELVALAVAIQRQQGSQLDMHARAALTAGATPEQVTEVLPITLLMDGAPALSQIPRVMAVIEAFVEG
jgi:AhpD family alkylhydroperoxidase